MFLQTPVYLPVAFCSYRFDFDGIGITSFVSLDKLDILRPFFNRFFIVLLGRMLADKIVQIVNDPGSFKNMMINYICKNPVPGLC